MRYRPVLALIAGVALAGAAVGTMSGRARTPDLATHVGTYVWHVDDPHFGGWSGLELSDDGHRFLSQSDKGNLISGSLTRDASGAVTAVSANPITPERGPDGKVLRATRRDSEGLAVSSSGKIYLSFEGIQRVLEYDRPDGPAHALPRDPAFLNMPLNGSLEALAVDAGGALYTMPEVGPVGHPIPVYRYAGGRWTQPFSLTRPDRFRPVGADFGPDGRLYILERAFLGIFGFQTRVIRVTMGAGNRPVDAVQLFQSYPGQYDNLEGLAVWRDAQSRIRLTMISDDNFLFLQKTELVDYVVAPAMAHAASAKGP
ncbi:esterase-like activity of phytase family protein [Acidimangrovimonas sediminis]|uniref:esterase-like activity of phytase family protein n=1 Tax=Acidimangrovimonas sediminis TaxID=2056283 RepID=UPI000C7FEAE1|nr:esterase-like activity of phytase family protein [Acidimangrovimonas sediminis]